MKTFQDFGIQVNRSSGLVKTFCPKCRDSRKSKNKNDRSLSVNIDKGLWKCHNCQWAAGLGNREKKDWSGNKVYKKPVVEFDKEIPKKVIDWFGRRAIPEKVLKRNQIGYNPKKKAIAFPYTKDGVCVNIKHRTADKKFLLESGCEILPYGWDDIENSLVVIVEGEIDKLAVETSGIMSCISVPNGASNFSFLENYEAKFLEIEKFIIAVDGDEPGQNLEENLSSRLGKDRCSKVVWPEGIKDANEFLLEYGPEALNEIIINAEPYPLDGIYSWDEFDEKLLELYEKGMPKGLEVGIANEYYSAALGELTVITGIPNHGKSSVLNQILLNLITKYNSIGEDDNSLDFKVGVFSPESLPTESYIARTCAQFTEKPFEKKYPFNRMTKEELIDAKNFLSEYIYMIQPDMGELNPQRILELARSLVMARGVKGIVLDPFNKFEHCRKKLDMSDGEYVAWFLNKWKDFAVRHNCHVWIVVHPRKMERDEKGKYKVPGIYDIIGPSEFSAIADNILCVYRDVTEGGPRNYLHIQKIRNFWIGKLGVQEIEFKEDSKNFYDAFIKGD